MNPQLIAVNVIAGFLSWALVQGLQKAGVIKPAVAKHAVAAIAVPVAAATQHLMQNPPEKIRAIAADLKARASSVMETAAGVGDEAKAERALDGR